MKCTCSFLATIEGIHEEGCAQQCPCTLDSWPLGEAVAFAQVRLLRCTKRERHDGDHVGVMWAPAFDSGPIARRQVLVTWVDISGSIVGG